MTVTEFTELPNAAGTRRVQFVPLVDHASKLATGWALGPSASGHAPLKAWAMAKRTWQDHGVDYRGITVHHDERNLAAR